MTAHTLLDEPIAVQFSADRLEDAILRHIDEQAVIGLDALAILLPEYSWSQVFHAIDRMARRGGITLRRHRSEYTLFSVHYAA